MNRIILDTIPELLCPLGEEVPDPWKSPSPTPTPETLEKPCSSQDQAFSKVPPFRGAEEHSGRGPCLLVLPH